MFKTKLRLRFIRPFTVVAKKRLAYTLNMPLKLRTHPVFYVGVLKPYREHDPRGCEDARAKEGGCAAGCNIRIETFNRPSIRDCCYSRNYRRGSNPYRRFCITSSALWV